MLKMSQHDFSSFSYRGYIHHYHISIVPDKCPRKVNRDIIETMVHAYNRIFGTKKPVFDGRSNLYVREPLPIGTETVDLEVRKRIVKFQNNIKNSSNCGNIELNCRHLTIFKK